MWGREIQTGLRIGDGRDAKVIRNESDQPFLLASWSLVNSRVEFIPGSSIPFSSLSIRDDGVPRLPARSNLQPSKSAEFLSILCWSCRVLQYFL